MNGDEQRGALARVLALPFVEAVVSLIAAIPLVWASWEHSILALSMGFLLSISRMAYFGQLSENLEPVLRLAAVLNMWRQTTVPKFQEMARAYLLIVEDDFKPLKDLSVEEANTELRELAERKRLGTMDTVSRWHRWSPS